MPIDTPKIDARALTKDRVDGDTRKKALNALTQERSGVVPALREFVDVATAYLTESPDEGFWKCDTAFRNLVASDFLTKLVNYELSKFESSHLYVPLMSFSSQLVIVGFDLFQLNVGVVSTRSTQSTGRMQSLPSHCMLAVAATPLTIAEYVQPNPLPTDDFRRDSILVEKGLRVWAPAAVIHIRAAHDIVDFRPEPGATSLVVNFSSKRFVEYAWEYERDTLRPVRFAPGDANWSRIDYAVQIMAAMGLAEHPAHFVRWSAIVKHNVDLLDLDSIAASAPQFRALMNNRKLITGVLNKQLQDWGTFQAGNTYTAQTFMLGFSPGFFVRVPHRRRLRRSTGNRRVQGRSRDDPARGTLGGNHIVPRWIAFAGLIAIDLIVLVICLGVLKAVRTPQRRSAWPEERLEEALSTFFPVWFARFVARTRRCSRMRAQGCERSSIRAGPPRTRTYTVPNSASSR